MIRFLKFFAISVFVLVVGVQFVRPERISIPDPPLDYLTMSQPVREVLGRACVDCHSYSTDWPWYTNVAPISWWIADHVEHGQGHLNFSEWRTYPPSKQRKLLEEICEEVEDRAMPLPTYTWIHRDAVLSDDEVEILCGWSRDEIAALAVTARRADL